MVFGMTKVLLTKVVRMLNAKKGKHYKLDDIEQITMSVAYMMILCKDGKNYCLDVDYIDSVIKDI